jgi:pimeloyl-ACP methyl ester carboxylesterase
MLGEKLPDYELHLWLGRDGAPRSAELRTASVVTRYRWQSGGLHITRHGDTRVLEPPEGVEADALWVVPHHALYVREAMFRLGVGMRGERAGHVAYTPADDAVVTLSFHFEPDGDKGVAARTERGRFVFAGEGSSAAAHLRLARVDTADGVELYVEREPGPPWDPALSETPTPRYVLPADLEISPVNVAGSGSEPTLAGELVTREDLGSGRHPGALFLSGSGPQERHGFVPGTSIDTGSHEIQDAMAKRGFVVLRYDDRGVGQSELGPTAAPGYQAFVSDARRALRALARTSRVDPRKIVIVGHSEGAMTATILGGERLPAESGRHRPAGIVLMAGIGRGLREVIYSQIRWNMKGRPAAEIEAALTEARRIHDAIERDGDVPASTEPARNWMKEMFREDPVRNLRQVKVPVLVVQGAKDFQVDPQLDFPALAAVVETPAGRRRGSETRLFENVDHLFKPEPGESKLGHYSDLSRRVDPRVIDHIVDWSATIVGP